MHDRFIQIILLVLILLPVSARAVYAQKDVIHVAFNELPPWKLLTPDGNYGGLDIEFLRMVAAKLNLGISFHTVPFKRGLKMLEGGELDMMIGVFRRPERERYLYFIEPPYKNSSDKAFYVHAGQADRITSHEDLHSLRVGTNLGSKYYPEFDSDTAIEKYPVSGSDLNIRKLLANRIDAYIATESTADYRLARRGLQDQIVKARFAHRASQSVYMVLSQHSPFVKRLAEFNAAVKALTQANTMDKLKSDLYDQLLKY